MFHLIPKLAIASAILMASLSAQSISHPVRLAAYGQSCGPTLTADGWFTSDKSPRMTFALASQKPLSLGIWFLGVKRVSLPIGNTNCSLFTMPILLFPFVTDQAGQTKFITVVPKKFKKTIYMQMALFPLDSRGFTIKTSNGMEITRKKP